jgi:hypothetical protein
MPKGKGYKHNPSTKKPMKVRVKKTPTGGNVKIVPGSKIDWTGNRHTVKGDTTRQERLG